MKMSSLLFGGLIGAAATLYVSRKRPGAVAWASSAMTDAFSSVSGKAMSKMINRDWKQEAMSTVPKHTDDTAEASGDAWGQIEAIIESDPDVKKEVDQIKAESSTITH